MVVGLRMYFPETKGLSLEGIAKLFADPVAMEESDDAEKENEVADHKETVWDY